MVHWTNATTGMSIATYTKYGEFLRFTVIKKLRKKPALSAKTENIYLAIIMIIIGDQYERIT